MAIPLRRCHATMLVLPPSPSNSTIINLAASSPATSPAAALLPPPALPSPITPLPVPSTFSSVLSPSSSVLPPSSSIPSTSSSVQPLSWSSTPPEPLEAPQQNERRLRPAPQAQGPPPNPAVPFPYSRCYACGPQLCDWCNKDRPPIGHKKPIPDFVVSTIIRHAMPHRFETLERIVERDIAMGTTSPPEDRIVTERDDDGMEYGPPGEFNPPAWTSDRARPKKSCLRKRESVRFTPYPSRSTSARPLLRRSTDEIKAALDEARANRISLNYEGPTAIAVRNEISAFHIPNQEPFKWEPAYTGPPSEVWQDAGKPLNGPSTIAKSSVVDLTLPSQEDIDDEAAVVQLLFPRRSSKRRHEDDQDDTEASRSRTTFEGSPTKKPRTTRNSIRAKFPGFAKTPSIFPSPSSILPSLSFATTSTPSPVRSASPSETMTAVPTDSSSSDRGSFSPASSYNDSQSASHRKDRIATKKLRFQFVNPASKHPKFGINDSIYLHHRRTESNSQKVFKAKKMKAHVAPPLGKKTWSQAEIARASAYKKDWDKTRRASFERKTSIENLEYRLQTCDSMDASAERFQKLVDRYEAGWPAIDLAGVRARYIRPRKNEVPLVKNKEFLPALVNLDEMRTHYPSWDHPAWDGVDRQAIRAWRNDPHYKLRVFDVTVLVEDEAAERRRANAEPDEATEIATVADEDEERMRREYLAAEMEEVEAPVADASGSAWAAPGPADSGLRREVALSETDLVSQWSAPAGLHSTGFESSWPTTSY